MGKACTGFGHRRIFENINGALYENICRLIESDYTLFYTGDMGQFDRIFTACVRRAKKEFPERKIELICVKPYLTKELNDNKEFYYKTFDDIIIPEELTGAYYKSAIKKRNRWMIDNSDAVTIFTVLNSGGAFEAEKYAEKSNKKIIKL